MSKSGSLYHADLFSVVYQICMLKFGALHSEAGIIS